MNYIFFAWVASIVFGLEVIIGKFTSKHTIANPWLFNFIWSLFIIILILPFALANHVGIPEFTVNLLWVGLTYAIANIFYIIALQLMDVTAMGPLFNFRSVFSVILGVIMLGEAINNWQMILIGIIFIAGILVNIDEKMKLKAFVSPGILAVMVFMTALAFMGIYTNRAITESGFWETSLWSMIIAQVIMLFTAPLFWKDLLLTPIRKYSGLFLMSIASAGGTLAANQAYSANVGITSTIMSLPFSMIFTIIISVINPKLLESHTVKIYVLRIFAAVVMLFAALELTK
jgi:drug/metabolite transporter (DMT)-like permease